MGAKSKGGERDRSKKESEEGAWEWQQREKENLKTQRNVTDKKSG